MLCSMLMCGELGVDVKRVEGRAENSRRGIEKRKVEELIG